MAVQATLRMINERKSKHVINGTCEKDVCQCLWPRDLRAWERKVTVICKKRPLLLIPVVMRSWWGPLNLKVVVLGIGNEISSYKDYSKILGQQTFLCAISQSAVK